MSLTPIIVIVMLGGAALSLRSTVRRRVARRDAAEQTAKALGLAFQSDSVDLKSSITKQMGEHSSGRRSSEKQVQDALTQSWVQKLTSMLNMAAPWNMSGDYAGYKVSIRQVWRDSGEDRKLTIAYKLEFQRPLSFKFLALKETLLRKLGKTVGLLQDIQSGNGELDKLVLLKGEPEPSVRAWISSPPRQEALEALVKTHPNVVVTESAITLDDDTGSIEVAASRTILDAFTFAAKELSR
jgi:hypothetical protein